MRKLLMAMVLSGGAAMAAGAQAAPVRASVLAVNAPLVHAVQYYEGHERPDWRRRQEIARREAFERERREEWRRHHEHEHHDEHYR